MNKIEISEFKSEYGELIIGTFDNKLCLCDWKWRKMRDSIDKRIKSFLNAEYIYSNNDLIDITISQLTEYFNNTRKEFDLPLLFAGSEFQINVWTELLKVSYGKTESYLGLAEKFNNVGAIRAVAAANGANAISIIVPCHRIIGSDGSLTGYAGGINTKKKLLQLEGSLNSNQLSFI